MRRPRDGRDPRTERIAVSLSAGERAALRAFAGQLGVPEATAAGRLILDGLEDAGAVLGPTQRATSTDGAGGQPLWLPTRQRVGAVVALLERYPRDLRTFAGLSEDDRLAHEHLAALSVWRDEIDTGQHRDPRIEIAFGEAVIRAGRTFEERGRRR
jgi:hypothetical protein